MKNNENEIIINGLALHHTFSPRKVVKELIYNGLQMKSLSKCQLQAKEDNHKVATKSSYTDIDDIQKSSHAP
jgi:hypothetical protein